jgi:hypothetical protein
VRERLRAAAFDAVFLEGDRLAMGEAIALASGPLTSAAT